MRRLTNRKKCLAALHDFKVDHGDRPAMKKDFQLWLRRNKHYGVGIGLVMKIFKNWPGACSAGGIELKYTNYEVSTLELVCAYLAATRELKHPPSAPQYTAFVMQESKKGERFPSLSVFFRKHNSLERTRKIIKSNLRSGALDFEKICREIDDESVFRNKKSGFIYICAAENGLTKIGQSECVKKRLTSIDNAIPDELQLIAVYQVSDMNLCENHLKQKFRDVAHTKRKIHGQRAPMEFFSLVEEDFRRIEEELLKAGAKKVTL